MALKKRNLPPLAGHESFRKAYNPTMWSATWGDFSLFQCSLW